MSKLGIMISDWGKPGAPMIIVSGGETVSLELHVISSRALDRCADYAGKRSGTDIFHLGFYGYLRICDAYCMHQSGVSVFDLAGATWRDHYDQRISPDKAVACALKAQGYPASEEEDEFG